MRGKSFVRMNAPGMHSSGPRPKLHCGSPVMTSSPTLVGLAQFSLAVPVAELPDGWQRTPSCWPFGFSAGVLPLLKITTRSPLGRAVGSAPWLKSHLCSERVGSKKLPKKQSASELPLMSSGVEKCRPPSVDIDPKIGDCWKLPLSVNRNTVQVT